MKSGGNATTAVTVTTTVPAAINAAQRHAPLLPVTLMPLFLCLFVFQRFYAETRFAIPLKPAHFDFMMFLMLITQIPFLSARVRYEHTTGSKRSAKTAAHAKVQ